MQILPGFYIVYVVKKVKKLELYFPLLFIVFTHIYRL
jgi:hypothetical protein